MDWLAKLPMTNLHTLATLLVLLATATRFLVWGKAGGDAWGEWLVFVASINGIGVAQFGLKRATWKPEASGGIPTRESTDPPREHLGELRGGVMPVARTLATTAAPVALLEEQDPARGAVEVSSLAWDPDGTLPPRHDDERGEDV
jgi:hypothetical protein